ncbi:MAG: hypothetical protein IJY50_04265 [Clostridia bacterium]|nr:hypothetical protein [Clostridia bacterium]
MPVELFTDIAHAALALLIAVLAIYLAVKLLGKLTKFVIMVVVIVLVIWLIFSDNSPVKAYLMIENMTTCLRFFNILVS